MLKKIGLLVVLATFAITPRAFAQDARVEAGVMLGWMFADGIDGDATITVPQGSFNRIDPKDSFKWNANVGALVGDNAEVGFMFSQAYSNLVAGGRDTYEIGDMTVGNYHGYFGYNFFDSDAVIRPYLFGGLGATSFGSVDYQTTLRSGTIPGVTKFSSTWGLGVKAWTSPNVGVKFGVQWTPTYIRSEDEGWWCDPWWGCYVVGDAKYANQWDLGGGVTFRF